MMQDIVPLRLASCICRARVKSNSFLHTGSSTSGTASELDTDLHLEEQKHE